MARLNQQQKLEILKIMLRSRYGDLREQSLIRQGKGWFHVSGMGHEALTVAGRLLIDGDFFCGYYRDRPIAIGRGVDDQELALSFFAKRDSKSGGRQMPAHYSSREMGIFSISSVVASSLIPACGLAWALQLDGKKNAVLTTVGDAGTRQGDFYEAIAFARERNLPMVFLVEDNGIGISSPTAKINPLSLGILNPQAWQCFDGCCIDSVHTTVGAALKAARGGKGPQFLWCRTERISSHSSADDQRKYRSSGEIEALNEKDPIQRLKTLLIEQKIIDEEIFQALSSETESEMRRLYEAASRAPDPGPEEFMQHVFGPPAAPPVWDISLGEKSRMVDAINTTFHYGLSRSKDFVFFGQDIEDPKGGVFSFTKGLSAAFPQQVFNSPLAESTIIGVAVGMAAYGKRPVFEIQFADYIWPGFNQLVTHLSTLHWRTNGEWTAPAVIYAPYGAYLPGGALWHSQTNEAAIAHFPGLQVAIPSNPEDAAGLFWSAMHSNSPTILYVPKHLMWQPRDIKGPIDPIPFGQARTRRHGRDITLVTWGNGVEVAELAIAQLGDSYDVECIDLRSIVPLDMDTIENSVSRTGRLLVVQEDAETCSVGQNIIARIVKSPLFNRLVAPPFLLAKPDVHIGYNPVLEYAALPSVQQVSDAIADLCSIRQSHITTEQSAIPAQNGYPAAASFTTPQTTEEISTMQTIRVPILGEGITSARVIRLITQPGESFQQDDPLCEVETDKALFPIEAPSEGILEKWTIEEGDDVEVDQVIALLRGDTSTTSSHQTSVSHAKPQQAPARQPQAARSRPSEGGLSPRIVAQLHHVVPAHMTVKVSWAPLRDARKEAKKQMGAEAPSPTVMVAWAMSRAMIRNPVFTCTVNANDTLTENTVFDIGVAVSLPNDALDTAVIHQASTLGFNGFCKAYQQAVQRVRSGQSVSKASVPAILTSMGNFGVRDALPVVVPPAIATIFLGEAHYELDDEGDPIERVSLCLSFDHRWMNGVAGAQFLTTMREEIENFQLNLSTHAQP